MKAEIQGICLLGKGEYFLGRMRAGKVVGLILGGLVVGVMLFMMFVILGGLMNGER